MNNSNLCLKICEGCGALWLRAESLTGVYCRRCVQVLAEMPEARERRGRQSGRMRRPCRTIERTTLHLANGGGAK